MFNISSCASQNSTAIISSTMEPPTSAASSSSSAAPGGRALDRHNPIVTDERRSGISSKIGTPIGTPCTNHVLQQKPKTPLPQKQDSPIIGHTKKGNNKVTRISKKSTIKQRKASVGGDHDNQQGAARRSFSKPSDLIMKAATCNISRPGVDYISPPESSRYLLDDTSFLDVLSDFDPVLKLAPFNSNRADEVQSKTAVAPSKPPKPPSSSSSGSSDQVVVLRVSLHCRGCEKKMKKHLSRLAGVTSFNIDFAAKKVTVVGDVTPLGVLASISKVKTAKLWAPAMSSSSQINSRSIDTRK